MQSLTEKRKTPTMTQPSSDKSLSEISQWAAVWSEYAHKDAVALKESVDNLANEITLFRQVFVLATLGTPKEKARLLEKHIMEEKSVEDLCKEQMEVGK